MAGPEVAADVRDDGADQGNQSDGGQYARTSSERIDRPRTPRPHLVASWRGSVGPRSEQVDVPLEVVGQLDQQLLPLAFQRCGAVPDVVDDATQIANEEFDKSLRVTGRF